MGKLLSGRYGHPPDAESGSLTLSECNQKLGLKPSDFVSVGTPAFFEKAFGAAGKYLLFRLEPEEVGQNAAWKAGYYLLPIDAVRVLDAFDKSRQQRPADRTLLPLILDCPDNAPPETVERAKRWADQSQPTIFRCACTSLELRLSPPRGLRRRWKARLRCPKRCQPPLVTLL